jgi:superfamily II DNA or RNA helicase
VSTVPIVIDNRIRISLDDVDVDCLNALKKEFEHKNSKRASMKHLGIQGWWNEPETYVTWQESTAPRIEPNGRIGATDNISFPRGGMSRIRSVLGEFGYEWDVQDLRNIGAPDVRREDIPDHLLEPYDFQLEARAIAIEKEQCIIKAPTGSGKTVIVFSLISFWKTASLILVPTSALMRQWMKRIPIELGIDPKDVGLIKGTKMKLRPITLAMPQTVSKRFQEGKGEEIADYFGAVFADEAQLFAANTFYNAVDPIPARYRITVSADHTRKDRKDFLVTDLFGDVAKSITKKRVIASGHVLDVEIWVIPSNFRADWYGLPDEEDEDGNEQHIDFDRLLDEMLRDDVRNKLVYDAIGEQIKNGKQSLAFTHRREHCLMIDRTLTACGYRTSYLLGGDDNKVEFEKTIEGLEQGTIDVGIGTYQATGTGLDLPRIGVGIGVTPIAANKQFFNQVCGRLARTVKDGSVEKTTAKLYYVWDRFVYPKHLRNLMKWNNKVFVWTGTSWMSARHYIEGEDETDDDEG